ncbi:MAG: regulatory protein [Kosmotoga sp.]|nr:regulatory protein [Kosmotoga sp.]MDK2952996.1 regulatory protein [Kosmotoga sp.]
MVKKNNNNAEIVSMARKEALRYLRYRARSEKEMKAYLGKRGYDSQVIEKVLAELKRQNFINDEQFCRLYVYDAFRVYHKGPFRIRQELRQLGISIGTIEKEIESFLAENDLKEIVKDYLNRHLGNEPLSIKKLEKLKARLYRKGFDPFFLNEVLREYLEESH